MLRERRVIDWTQPRFEQGRKEGRKEGQAELLHKQLEQRFGPLDEASRERLADATPEQLECWARRVLDAPSLQEVLED